MSATADASSFVAANTRSRAPPLVPEISLRVADDALPLWHLTERELDERGLPAPYWAFAWAGGQALARYVLDHPRVVAGRSVLDIGSGSGLVAIAAAKAGAVKVTANEIDLFACAAMAQNLADNETCVDVLAEDILDRETSADVVLAGDVFYEREFARRTLTFLDRASVRGALVLIGDPERSHLPRDRLIPLATFHVAAVGALEDTDVKRTRVWRFRDRQDRGTL